MAGENKDGPSIPYSGLIGAALIAALVASHQVRLESARPTSDARTPHSRTLHQDVDARLWQDPFFAVAQFRERHRVEALQESQLRRKPDASAKSALKEEKRAEELLPPDQSHDLRTHLVAPIAGEICPTVARPSRPVRLLFPMVLGGRTEEDAEMRRRTRYAVASGLMNAGYIPDNSEAIGYAHVPPSLRNDYETRVPQNLPFEWFGRYKDGKAIEWVLVVWLDQSQFYAKPIQRLQNLVRLLTPPKTGKCSPPVLEASVLGPVDSDMAAMVQRDLPFACPVPVKAGDGAMLSFVSASVTGRMKPDPYCVQDKAGTVRMTRVIGPDVRLSAVLAEELKLRHLQFTAEGKSSVIVISEHDTGYGRDFAEHAERHLGVEFKIKSFSYLRQIDGGRPIGQRPSRGQDGMRDAEKQDNQPSTRSHGAVHVDYLQRLVQEVERYREGEPKPKNGKINDAKKEDHEKKDVVAVAVFGNDVYDKLLILRALRPRFPKAQFLTTDLDARLLDPEEVRWTRNLVVATNFGLTLDQKLQAGAAPFRDGYQTATYLAALLIGGRCAVDVVRANASGLALAWLKAPLLFEIGRDRSVSLNLPESALPKGGASARESYLRIGAENPPINLAGCKFADSDIRALESARIQPPMKQPDLPTPHFWMVLAGLAVFTGWMIWLGIRVPVVRVWHAPEPPPSPWTPPYLLGMSILAVLFLMLAIETWKEDWAPIAMMFVGIFFAILHCSGQYMLRKGLSHRLSRSIGWGLLFAIPGVLLLIVAVVPALVDNAEPFAWIEGVSIWPTQILRGVAAALACFSLWHIGAVSARNGKILERRFRLKRTPDGLPVAGMDGMSRAWNRHSFLRLARTAKTIVAAAVYFVICFILMNALDARPGFPVRGEGIYAGVLLLGFGVFMGIVVLMAMIFACIAFEKDILAPVVRRRIPHFPEACVNRLRRACNLPDDGPQGNRRFLEVVLMVELVALRTQSLIKLIYFPFAVFALMVVARGAVFDNWDTPLGLGIVLGLPFIAVIGCMIWLRFGTLRFHRKAIDVARAELIRLRGVKDAPDGQSWQLEKLFERLRDEERGSFQNILLQPMVRALLLPLGGFSGIELLEQFVLNR